MPLRSQREEHDRTCRPSPSGWSVFATADTATERRTASLTSCGCGGRGRRRRAIARQGEHGASQLRACRRPPRPSPDLLLLSLSWTGGGEECFPKLGNGGGRDGEQKLEGGRRVRPLKQREWREAATLKALPLRVNLLWPAEKNAIYFTMD